MTWEQMLDRYGEWGIWERMKSLPSFRAYCRRWPLDDRTVVLNVGECDYIDEVHLQPEEIAQSNSFTAWFLATLPPRQREVVERTFEGYKPREIAKVLGHGDSSRVRYHKWAIAQRLDSLRNFPEKN